MLFCLAERGEGGGGERGHLEIRFNVIPAKHLCFKIFSFPLARLFNSSGLTESELCIRVRVSQSEITIFFDECVVILKTFDVFISIMLQRMVTALNYP